MSAATTHNELTKRLFMDLMKSTEGNESDTFVALESLILGVMLYYRPIPDHAATFLASMSMAVIKRLEEKS